MTTLNALFPHVTCPVPIMLRETHYTLYTCSQPQEYRKIKELDVGVTFDAIQLIRLMLVRGCMESAMCLKTFHEQGHVVFRLHI